MEVGPITVKMILGRERSFGQKQGEEKETSPFQRQQYYSAGSAVPRSAGFIAVQRDPHKDKSNSLPPPPQIMAALQPSIVARGVKVKKTLASSFLGILQDTALISAQICHKTHLCSDLSCQLL